MSTSLEDTREIERVLVLGDVHGESGWFKKAARTAKQLDCQVILQVGDMGFWPHRSSGKVFWRNVKEYCERFEVECWWIDGNHENFDWLEAQPHHDEFWRDGPVVHCGRGSRWVWNGVRFLACGGAYSIDKNWRTPHESWWPQETITAGDLYRCGDEQTDVMVTHDAPYGAAGVMGRDTAGDKDSYPASTANRLLLAELLKLTKPKLLVHGHYHHRNSTQVLGCKVEGFHRDGNRKSMGILELPSLKVSDIPC